MLWLTSSLNIFVGSNETGLYRLQFQKQNITEKIMCSLNLLHVSSGLYNRHQAVVQIHRMKCISGRGLLFTGNK